MKKYLIFLAVFCLSISTVSCGVMSPGDSEEQIEAVAAAVKSKDVSIVVNYIFPTTMSPRPSTDGYTLKIKDGKLNGHLPFFGTSTSGGYSPNDGGFDFNDCPIKIKEKKFKDKVEWRFDAVSGTETERITVTIWNNGSADIFIQPYSKSSMRYSGELE